MYKDLEKATQVPKKLWDLENLMKEIPNWNKNNYSKSEKVYQNKEFIILKVQNGKKTSFIVYNTKKEWSKGHTHLHTRTIAEILIKNVINKRKPKTNNLYVLRSHIRVSDDEKYIKFIEELIETKKNKEKKQYINKKVVRK